MGFICPILFRPSDSHFLEMTVTFYLENLMPLFIECIENDITLGEICNTLREVPAPALREAPSRWG